MNTTKFPRGVWTSFDKNGVEYSKCRCGKVVYSDEEYNKHYNSYHSETTLADIGVPLTCH